VTRAAASTAAASTAAVTAVVTTAVVTTAAASTVAATAAASAAAATAAAVATSPRPSSPSIRLTRLTRVQRHYWTGAVPLFVSGVPDLWPDDLAIFYGRARLLELQ